MLRANNPKFSLFEVLIPIAIGLIGFFLVAGASILNVQNIAWLGDQPSARYPIQH
jgi:hypothetical protein